MFEFPNYQKLDTITKELVIILFILILLAVVIVVKAIKKERAAQVEFVKRTSKRYLALLSLNARYSFNLFPREYHRSFTVDSKAKFDRFDFDSNFCWMIYDERFEFRTILLMAKDNEQMYADYMRDLSRLPEYASEKNNYVTGMSIKRFGQIEWDICQEAEEHPTTYASWICHLNYTSPQGLNVYNSAKRYGMQEVAQLLSRAAEIERNKSEAAYQRSLMTDSLRYDVMKRDHFRCVLCGRTAMDGIKLHVDHIKPVSKGGLTEMSNLRTLCDQCNLGKRDKWDEDGIN